MDESYYNIHFPKPDSISSSSRYPQVFFLLTLLNNFVKKKKGNKNETNVLFIIRSSNGAPLWQSGYTLVGSSREGKVGIEFREQGWSPIQ